MSTVVNGLAEITALAGRRPGTHRLDGGDPGTGEHVRRCDRRPPVDPHGQGAGGGRVFRRHHRARLPHLVHVIPLFAGLLKVTGISMGINYGLNKVRFPAPVPVGLHSADELCLDRLGVGRGGAWYCKGTWRVG